MNQPSRSAMIPNNLSLKRVTKSTRASCPPTDTLRGIPALLRACRWVSPQYRAYNRVKRIFWLEHHRISSTILALSTIWRRWSWATNLNNLTLKKSQATPITTANSPIVAKVLPSPSSAVTCKKVKLTWGKFLILRATPLESPIEVNYLGNVTCIRQV